MPDMYSEFKHVEYACFTVHTFNVFPTDVISFQLEFFLFFSHFGIRFASLSTTIRTIMIRCHLARLMGEHKMRIADVVRETGLSRNTITLLYKETAQKVDLDTLERLCVLFDCEIHDLLQKVPASQNRTEKNK
ncbi:helix-turn-helix domain-containing protein [Escherichia coli]